MGVAAINQVLKDVYDEEFAYELNVQADKMEQFARKAGIRLRENGSEPSEPKPIASSYAGNCNPYETGITEQNRGCGGSHRKRK